jgi:tetratricopeptide (TPR) repeat protein
MKCWITLSIGLLVTACRKDGVRIDSNHSTTLDAKKVDPLALALVPHSGDTKADREIVRWQQQVREGRQPETALEALGWAYVAKAREGFDPGFYKLAEQCAFGLETRQPNSPEALLLRGHVLHNLHRFKEAEPLARELVARRGLAFDYGLLGDVLMEQGRLDEALVTYQQMVDLRPDLQSYARAAHIRWLKGDLAGALELMQMAVSAASPRDPESAAWVNTRLGLYLFQAGARTEALRAAASALEFQSDYPPALLLGGRMLLAQGKPEEAVQPLKRAVERNPLPEYQWALAEALRAAGRDNEASAVERALRQHGASADPRTYALYLATRGEDVELAARLSEKELDSRGDVFTHDALAWSLAAAGRVGEASGQMEMALAEGTQDARLFFHAATVSARCGRPLEAGSWLQKARQLAHLLLPSERAQLQAVSARVVSQAAAAAPRADATEEFSSIVQICITSSPSPQPSPSGRGGLQGAALGESEPFAASQHRQSFLPLPEGEGRGEGEQDVRTRRDLATH